MSRSEEPPSGMREALRDASELARERDKAAASPDSVQHRTRMRGLSAAIAALVVVGAWDVHVLTRPPEPLAPGVLEVDLQWMVATTVEAIEDFRAVEGRLPTPEEVEAVLEEDVSYTVIDDRYVVTGRGDGVEVRFDGTVGLDAWLGGAAPAGSGAGGPS